MGGVRRCGALYGDLSTADEVSELVRDDRTDSLRVLRRMSGLLRSKAVPTSEVRSAVQRYGRCRRSTGRSVDVVDTVAFDSKQTWTWLVIKPRFDIFCVR